MATTIRVFVADSHPVTCVGIRAILDQTTDLQVIGEAHHLSQLDVLSADDQPDVLLIAANLATDSLVTTMPAWKQQFANSKLLLMLPQADETCLQQLTAQSADGAILKTESSDKFIQAIRMVAQGDTWLSQPLWQNIMQSETISTAFTEAEKALLPLIVTEMTIEEMALTLHLSDSTLKRRLQEIYAKLGVETLRGAAVKLVRLGLA